MATIQPDENLHPIDVRRSYVLTRILELRRAQVDIYDVPFCPIRGINDTKVKLLRKFNQGTGVAQFRAPGASTPLVTKERDVQEVYIEMANIAEKDVLDEKDLLALNSQEARLAESVMEDIIAKAQDLRWRNLNQTRLMAWTAAKGSLTITYPNGSSVDVDWDFDGGDLNSQHISSTHLPTAAASWATVGTDVLEDIYTWSKLIADDLGIDQQDVVMFCNSTIWRYLKKNTGLKAELSSTNPRIITPRREEAATIMEIAEVIVNNDHYYADDSNPSTKVKFLPDTHVLFVARPNGRYEYGGAPLMEMYDGLVSSYNAASGRVGVGRNPGLVADIWATPDPPAEYVRVQSRRMPIVNWPAAFVYAQVIV